MNSKLNCRLLRIDIYDWDAEVTQQYGIRMLPTVWLYQGKKQVERVMRDVIDRVSDLD